jgi:hypothetical protein
MQELKAIQAREIDKASVTEATGYLVNDETAIPLLVALPDVSITLFPTRRLNCSLHYSFNL